MTIHQHFFTLTLLGCLTACGGDGYYGKTGTTTPTPDTDEEETAPTSPQQTLNTLKAQGQSLFGQVDSDKMGYIDHALDTYSNGIMQLSKDIRELDLSSYNAKRKETCFTNSTIDHRACYVFTGEEIKTLLGGNYANWDFEITADDLKNIRLKSSDISPKLDDYIGRTTIYIFENENPAKHLQDIAISGAFAYPFTQSTGLQKRFVLINAATSDFQLPNADSKTGALSIYKVPEENLYVTEAGSGFSTLINDNTNVAFAEPIQFKIDSQLGIAPSTYKIDSQGVQTLSLAQVDITGTRVEHEPASLNDYEFKGSIWLQGTQLFDIKQAGNGTTLKFEHYLNALSIKGQSTVNNNQVTTQLTSPSGVRY